MISLLGGIMTEPIARLELDARELLASYPPRLRNANKKTVFAIASSGAAPSGHVVFTRWRSMPVPPTVPPAGPEVQAREDVFGYEPSPPRVVEWYLNFADPELFFAYGGGLLAQDELQVAEHPVLASLREALVARKIECATVAGPAPTPVLVTGAERRCRIATRGL